MNIKAMIHFKLPQPRTSAPQRNSQTLLPALALCLTFCTRLSVAAADDPKVFNIERQSLAAALSQFAAQSDRQILFSTDVVAAKRSNSIKASWSRKRHCAACSKVPALRIASPPITPYSSKHATRALPRTFR